MNTLYQTGLNAFLNADIDADSDTFSCIAVNSGYTPNFAANGDQFLSAIAGGNRLGSKVHLTSVSTSGNQFTAANTDMGSTWTGNPTIQAFVIFKDTGVDATSQLIAYIDGFQPVTVAFGGASNGATTIPVDPLPFGIASGASFTIAGVTLALTASAGAGARSLTVTAISGSLAAGATGPAPIVNANMPIATTNTQDLPITWPGGLIFSL